MDFTSRTWLTYRKEFPSLEQSDVTSDAGWGCMLRTGQMVLAEALVRHFLGREWRTQTATSDEFSTYRRLLRWFADVPSDDSPFGVHSLVNLSVKKGRRVGQWFGPAQISYLIRDAMNHSHRNFQQLRSFRVYVAQDCTVYKGDVIDLLQKGQADVGSEDCAVLVLIPIRLGGETLNEIYFPCIKALLSMDGSLGIMGGKPSHSLYFIGWQDDKLVYLDPHYCQSMVDMRQDEFPLQSFCCDEPRRVSMNRMDPSCTLAFYCKNQTDFQKWCHDAAPMIIPPHQRSSYPFFTFHSGRSWQAVDGATPPSTHSSPSSHSATSHRTSKRPGKSRLTTYSIHLHSSGEAVPLGLMGIDNDDEQDTFLVVDKADGRTDRQIEEDYHS